MPSKCCGKKIQNKIKQKNTHTDSFTFTFAGTRWRKVWEGVGCQPLDQKYDSALLEDFRGWLAANTVSARLQVPRPGGEHSLQIHLQPAGSPVRPEHLASLAGCGQGRTKGVPWLPGCEESRAEETEACWRDVLFGTGRWARTPGPAASAHGSAAEHPVQPEDAAGCTSSTWIYHWRTGILTSASQSEFLFALRYAQMHAMVASAARPSALYTLSMEAMKHPVSHWEDGVPVLLRKPYHKTGAYIGPCHVFSGWAWQEGSLPLLPHGEKGGPAALGSRLCGSVLQHGKGKGLNASMVMAHLAVLQLYCSVDKPVCQTSENPHSHNCGKWSLVTSQPGPLHLHCATACPPVKGTICSGKGSVWRGKLALAITPNSTMKSIVPTCTSYKTCYHYMCLCPFAEMTKHILLLFC